MIKRFENILEVVWNLLSLEHLFLFSAFLKLQKMLLLCHWFIILFDGKHIYLELCPIGG